MKLRIIGGTDYAPQAPQTESHVDQPAPPRVVNFCRSDERPRMPVTATGKNQRLRKQRRGAWWKAERAVHYWRARLDLQSAISCAQHAGLTEGNFHPPTAPADRDVLLENYRAALVKQLLTPAPTVADVKWKQLALARGDHKFTDARTEKIERAIADDLAFLAAHPTRRARGS